MKFTLLLADLQTLLKSVGVTRPRKAEVLTLSACAARVFVEFKGDVAGIEALVMSDGAVTVSADKFVTLIKTYKGTRSLSFEGGSEGLKVQSFQMSILAWIPEPQPPAALQVFPVTDVVDSAQSLSNPIRES
jgi:hypothetical protein